MRQNDIPASTPKSQEDTFDKMLHNGLKGVSKYKVILPKSTC